MARYGESTGYVLRPLLVVSLLVVSAFVGGIVGVTMVLAMIYASFKTWLVDSAEKHGISEINSSRFGGLLVFIGVVAFVCTSLALSGSEIGSTSLDFSPYFRGYEWVALLAGGLGLWEDYTKRLSAKFRLQLLFFIVASYYLIFPSALPTDVFPSYYPHFLNHPVVVGLGVTVCVVGFINAGNIADGANGLLSCIAMAVFLIAYMETGALIYIALLASVFVFAIFNMSTGLMFLGDFGSYGLSALMALVCVDLYSQGGSSLWFYACLLGYPSVELIRVVVARWRRGASPMTADNNHLHNRLFSKFKMMGLSPLIANSFTGLTLSLLSTLLPLVGYLSGVIPIDSMIWGFIFLVYSVLHVLLFDKIANNNG